MTAHSHIISPASKTLKKTLDQLARVTAILPADDEMIGYLIEAGEIGDPPPIKRAPKDA